MAIESGAVRAALVLVACSAVAGGMLVAHPAAGETVTVSEDPSPTYQTNGRVNAIITVGDKVFVGGDFTEVRPAGSPAGTDTVPRQRLAAFSTVTGELLGWNPGVNSTVNALAASPDGKTIYVGGKFGRLVGHPRRNLGAVRASNGNVTRFRADTDRRVLALATAGSRVYVGGKLSKIDGKTRSRLAAVSAKGRVLTKWRPPANAFVRAIAISRDRKNVFIGGDFTRVNGKKQHHLAKISVKKARLRSLQRHPGYPVVQIVASRKQLYLAGNGPGGHAASYTVRGHFRWVKQTDGAVHSVALLDGVLYVGGQFNHVCVGNTGGPTSGFDCRTVLAPRRHLTALAGADGAMLPWDPRTDSINGVFAVSATADSVRIGGDFTVVNGSEQQGFALFGPPPAPPTTPATP